MPLEFIRCDCGTHRPAEIVYKCTCTPKPYLWSIVRRLEDRGDRVSPSALGGCLAKPFLQSRENYTVSLADLHWAQFRGSLVHGSMEEFKEHELSKDYLIEESLSADLGGIPLRGTIDNYDKTTGTLWDWKTTKGIYPKYLPKADHVTQMYGYVYLLRANSYNVTKCTLFYMDASETYKAPLPRLPSQDELVALLTPAVAKLKDGYVNNMCPEPMPSALCDGTAKGGKIFCSVKKFCPIYNPQYRGKVYDQTKGTA